MRQFIVKILLLAGLLVGFKAALWRGIHTYRPKRSFRYEAAYKRDSLLWPIRHQVNTVFIGSSRTACSIIPAQFDSLTNHRTASFNHGLSGLFVPDTFDETCALINMDGLKVQTIFLELSFPPEVAPVDPFDRNRPFAELMFAMDYMSSHAGGYQLPHQLTARLDAFITKLLMLKDLVRLTVHSVKKPVDENYVMTPSGYRYFRAGSPSDRPKAVAPAVTPFAETIPANEADTAPSVYRLRIEQLIRLCQRKKITLYFIIPNHLMQAEKRMLPGIYAAIPTHYRFCMPTEHNSLAQMGVQCSDDGMHLNRRGARIFTARFAAQYNQLTPLHGVLAPIPGSAR